MHRRTFIEMVAASLMGTASSARAQPIGKTRRLGILTAGTIGSGKAFVAGSSTMYAGGFASAPLPIPEPSTSLLMFVGVAAHAGRRR